MAHEKSNCLPQHKELHTSHGPPPLDECSVCSGTNWKHLEPPRNSWNHLEPPRNTWNHLVPPRTTWNHLEQPRTTLNHPEPPEPCRLPTRHNLLGSDLPSPAGPAAGDASVEGRRGVDEDRRAGRSIDISENKQRRAGEPGPKACLSSPRPSP
ncbi:unnamed protein product [Gadus morhua 'NCC']